MQFLIKDWLVQHQYYQIDDLGGITIEDLVEDCHELSLEQYGFLYSIYAGDMDYVLMRVDEEDEEESVPILDEIGIAEEMEVSSEHGKYKKINIPDRWGGTPEIYAFSSLMAARINIYVIKRYDKKTQKVVLGKKIVKNSRLQLYQRVEIRPQGNFYIPDLNLLLIEKKGYAHYQYLEKLT